MVGGGGGGTYLFSSTLLDKMKKGSEEGRGEQEKGM